MKLSLVGVLLIMILLTACKTEQTESQDAVVAVKAGESKASGVLYKKNDDQLVVLTAAHVLQSGDLGEGDVAEVVFADGLTVKTEDYIISETSETAFLNLSMEKISGRKYKNLQPVNIDKESFDALAEGTILTMRGASAENNARNMSGYLMYPWIYIEDFDQYMMLVKGESFPGMSGGGLFDGDGNFVGILCGVNEAGETAAIPLSIILAEYAQYYAED